MSKQLSQEMLEEIALFAESPHYEAVQRLLEILVKDAEARVLSFNLTTKAEGIILEKARCEGAYQLQRNLLLKIEQIRTKVLK